MAEGKQTAGARSSRAWRIAGLALAGLLVLAGCAGISGERAQEGKGPPKYILLLFADGAGIAHFELGRIIAERIHQEGFLLTDVLMRDGAVGLMTTHSAEFLTTDSAAAGTAMATGCKARIDAIGVCADGRIPKAVAEVAKARGMAIALVTNAEVYDASPAAFSVHTASRRNYGEILDQYLRLEPDVLMGGGRDQFLPAGARGSRRKDSRDVVGEFRAKGYGYVSNLRELRAIRGPRLLGLFADKDMSYEMDRDIGEEPSLADMAEATLRMLGGTGRPFFAFLETENLDTASHNTDIAGVVHDLRAFDRALRVAYDFYRRHRDETLLLVVADHETGGLSITSGPKGADGPGRGEWVDPGERELRMILSIRCSLREAERRLGKEPRPQQLDGVMADCFPGFELPEDVRAAIAGGRPLEPNLSTRPVQHLLGLMVARNTLVCWGSAHHTAQPVPVVAIGVGAGAFRGYYDNTDFGRKLLSILGESPN